MRKVDRQFERLWLLAAASFFALLLFQGPVIDAVGGTLWLVTLFVSLASAFAFFVFSALERMSPDPRRTYFDHEPAYRVRRDPGGTGWSTNADDGAYDRVRAFLADHAFGAGGGWALDAGCGGGEVCIELATRGWRAVGFDFAETALALAAANARAAGVSARFVRADVAATWPVPDDTFDLVVDNHVLHCLIDSAHRAAFLANAYRVLKPGGRLFSVNMTREGALDLSRLEIDPDTGVNRQLTRIWVSKDRLLDGLGDAGFTVCQSNLYGGTGNDDSGDELVVVGVKPV